LIGIEELFKEALPLAEKAFHIRNEILGEKHRDTLTNLYHLAFIYTKLGRLSEALPWYEKGYRIGKEVLGEKHPQTLVSLNNLASTYNNLGSLSEALPLSEKCYRLRKIGLGEKHPDTISSLGLLATIYHALGRLSEALPLVEKGYPLSEEVLGEKHPRTLVSLNNLALIYQDLGRLSEALPLYEKGYRLSKEVLGEKHHDTLISLNNLASIEKNLGRLSEALPLYEKGYVLMKDVLGEKHSHTLLSLNNLAGIYSDLGRLSEALPLSEKCYRLSKEVLGEKHSTTLLSLNNLAGIYNDLGRLSEALPLYEKGYHLSKDVLGEKHPDTLTSLNNLAFIYNDLGRLSEALPLYKKNYRLSKEVLGEKHLRTLLRLNNLAGIYSDLGSLSEALPLSEKCYRLRKEVLGEKHPDTLTSLNNLAYIYENLSRLSEALPLYEKGCRLMKDVLGEKHPNTLLCLSNLAYAYIKQGNINQAIKHFETFVAGVESLRSGDLSAENRQSLFKQWVPGYFLLSALYAKQSRPQEAFRLAELSKARTLLESLAAKLAAQQGGLSNAEQLQLQNYEKGLASLNNRIAKALEENRIEDRVRLETDKNQLLSQLTQFQRKLKAKYPKYARLSEVQILNANDGATLVPAEAVFISYLTDKNKVLAFTIQANGKLTAHDLGEIPELEKDLEIYRSRLKKGRGIVLSLKHDKMKDTKTLSRELGKRLLEPLKDIIKDKAQWIISPSGALAFIPFETLRFEGEKQPVIAQHQISYVQSLSVLAMLQERDKAYKLLKNRGSLFAMGAPIYESVTAAQKPSSEADLSQSRSRQIAKAMKRSGGGEPARALGQLDLKWDNLPGTEKELKQLGNLFFLRKHRSRVFKQADATEAKLQRLNKAGLLAKYRYIVFSTHGYLSPQVP
jgi:tetratricopeptide (TPR) repeat protein